jgi:hypothetical protein
MTTLVSGTTGPPLTLTFTRAGAAIDLTGCTVVATIQRPGLTTLTRSLTVLSPATNGQAQLLWETGDLTLTSSQTQVQYLIDFLITDPTFDEIQPTSLPVTVRAPLT